MDNKVYNAIRQELPYLNPALRRIGDYILQNPETCKTITIKSLANSCQVAESTVTRFVKEMGYSSFQELKISLAEYLMTSELLNTPDSDTKLYEDINKSDSLEQVIEKLVYRNTFTLNETRQNLNIAMINQAVDYICDADTLILSSQGFSNIAASEAVMMFSRIGKKCILFGDECNQLMAASVCRPSDLFIGISNSGRTKKVVETLKIVKENLGRTIGITSFDESPVAHYSDIPIITPTKSKSTENGMTWELASAKTAQILVIDVLCACYSLRHYDETLKNMDATYQALKNTRNPT